MKKALVCCAGAFIGGHLVRRLKDDDDVYWVRDVNIKMHEYVESAVDRFVKSYLRLIGVIL